MRVRAALPTHHLSDDSKHVLEIGLGIIGTMAGLLLGLLVASATTSYNGLRNEVLDTSSKIVLLDRILASYGPDANDSRRLLRTTLARAVHRIWPESGSTGAPNPVARDPDALLAKIAALSPKNESQRSLKPQAIGLLMSMLQNRWLMLAQTASSVSVPLLIVLVFWFAITFTGFGIFAPPNVTVVLALALCALAVAGAVFLILEMYSPLQGVLQISGNPLRNALTLLGR